MSVRAGEVRRDLLDDWTSQRSGAVPRQRGSRRRSAQIGLRFAFYGRISTEDYQDHSSSREWQRTATLDLIVGRGRIVSEFFDVGHSRLREWADRPQAAALLAAVANRAPLA